MSMSASWINRVERWFAELTRKQIQRGVHTSVRQLEADIRTFIDLRDIATQPLRAVFISGRKGLRASIACEKLLRFNT
jgi:hypothetical protein